MTLSRTLTSLAVLLAFRVTAQQPETAATIHVAPTHVLNHVSPRMYAGFVRSFEQPPDYLGLPSHWQLEPDERNDNVGAIRFALTTEEAYPRTDDATQLPNHSLRIALAPEDITDARRGFSQGRLSFRAGETYKGSFWAKIPLAGGYNGHVRLRPGWRLATLRLQPYPIEN